MWFTLGIIAGVIIGIPVTIVLFNLLFSSGGIKFLPW